MDEMEHHQWQIFNEKYALVLNKAVFKWEKDNLDTEEQVKVKSKEVMEMKGISGILTLYSIITPFDALEILCI